MNYFAFGAHGENTLSEGEWKMDFDLAYTDTTREFSVSEKIKIDGANRRLEKIMIFNSIYFKKEQPGLSFIQQ